MRWAAAEMESVGRGQCVRSDRGDDNELHFSGINACLLQSRTSCVASEVTGMFAFGSNVSFFDPGARCDPLVRSVHRRLKVVIGQHPLREVATSSSDLHRE